MNLFKTVLVFLLTLLTLTQQQNKYCQLNCDYVIQTFKHTVCERNEEKCGPSPSCGPDFRVVPLTNGQRQYIVDLHNYLRNQVAMGNESRNSQPPASNMNILAYNPEMEFVAQCWANTCHGNPLLHDNCRRTAQYDHVGQNLGFTNSTVPITNIYATLKDIILLWYNEVAIFHNKWVTDTRDRGSDYVVGHYTQMLWANTKEIGCAMTYYTSFPVDATQKSHHIILVCNYGPGGNYLGLPVYEIGKPSTKCSNNLRPNKHYKGLCGKYKHITQIINNNKKIVNNHFS